METASDIGKKRKAYYKNNELKLIAHLDNKKVAGRKLSVGGKIYPQAL